MSQNRGIIVASDAKGEWLLPWWWERYSSANTLPVAFIDFGMTEKTLSWCKERGIVIPYKQEHSLTEASYDQLEGWTKIYGESYRSSRDAWFKKPHACLLSPFEETLWIDIDCEVLDSVEEAFSYLKKECAVWYGSSLSIPEGLEEEAKSGVLCNSGVVVFKRNSFIVKEWARKAVFEQEKYFGDECILSSLIYRFPDLVTWLPEEYNWRMSRGVPFQAKIIHWKGEWGKQYIAAYGGLKPLIQEYFPC